MSAHVPYINPKYTMGWVHKVICDRLDQFLKDVEDKKSPRLMIFMPPRHGKSLLVSTHFPPFVLGRHPDWDWITASYGSALPQQFSQSIRMIVESAEYQNLYPGFALREDANEMMKWRTSAGGTYLATSVGGATTGMGAAIFSIDDPIKDMQDADSPAKQKECWEFYNAVATTRMRSGGGIILTQTLWSLNDTSMRLLETARECPDADQWDVLKFPALATEFEDHRAPGETLAVERIAQHEMEKKRANFFANGQARMWHAMYQQNPVPDDGAYFKKSDLRTYAVPPKTGRPILVLDAAFSTKESADRTTLFAWAESEERDLVCLPGGFMGRCNTFETCQRILKMAREMNAHTLVAGKDHIVGSIGEFLKKMMIEERTFLSLEEVPEKGDKVLKAKGAQARSQMQKVLFPAGMLFNDLILPELLAFPAGKHDDFVDNFAKAAIYINKFSLPAIPAAPPKPKLDFMRRPSVRPAAEGSDLRLFGAHHPT